jgi:hypothetical protein
MQLCETHMGNLRVAVAIAELCNKIALYMMDQIMFIIKTFYSSSGSCVAVERQYRREFSICVSPLRDTICQLLNSLKKQEVCVINVQRDINVHHLFIWKKPVCLTRQEQEVQEKVCDIWHNRLGSQPALHGQSVIRACCCCHTQYS